MDTLVSLSLTHQSLMELLEGAARQTDKEFTQFLFIAQGSCAELETQLIISEKLKFISDSTVEINNKLSQIMKMLTRLRQPKNVIC
jgi:four helix bundle protein